MDWQLMSFLSAIAEMMNDKANREAREKYEQQLKQTKKTEDADEQ